MLFADSDEKAKANKIPKERKKKNHSGKIFAGINKCHSLE